jgi:MoaA/NifB/PqqE/SkfB family radical SAM enzyme
MRAEQFGLDEAARVLEHPDTPSAYVDWAEVLPLVGHEDRTYLGNLLGWAGPRARTPLGASRDTFARAISGLDESLLDRLMESLATAPVQDFVDHYVPFLRNVSGLVPGLAADAVVGSWLDAYQRPRPGELTVLDRKLGRAWPDSVILEVTKSCNFACGMCSSRTGGFLPEQTMPLPVFGELVRLFGPGASSLRVNGFGETTLVPNLHRYLDCLEEFGYQGLREIITNMSGAEQVYLDLFARGFVILASWDATSADLFETLRSGACYEELLPRLHALGRAAHAEPERLGLLCTVQQANLGEVVSLVRLAAEVGAGLVIFNMVKEADGSPWMDARFEEIAARFAEADAEARRLGVVVRIPDHVGRSRLKLPQARRSSGTFCDRPWRELLVRWDTEVAVCNMFNPFSYGLLRQPGPERDVAGRFRRLWEGPNATLFRGLVNSKAPHPYCRECYFLYS